ncbi:hypothetical protein L208DRAFT_1552885, partial [Tricholoma matsutake]
MDASLVCHQFKIMSFALPVCIPCVWMIGLLHTNAKKIAPRKLKKKDPVDIETHEQDSTSIDSHLDAG